MSTRSRAPVRRVEEVGAGEAARLQALHGYGVLDAPADDELTAVVRAAAVVAPRKPKCGR